MKKFYWKSFLSKTAYRSHHFFKGWVGQPESRLKDALLIAGTIKLADDLRHWSIKDPWKPILAGSGLLFYFSIGTLIQRGIINVGIRGPYIFPNKYIKKRREGNPWLITLSDIDPNNFEFANNDTAYVSAQLNYEAYKNGAWSTSIEDKYQRNKEHIAQNSKCFMFIKSRIIKHKYIGFTHLLPINVDTWNLYLEGKIGDNDFSKSNIVSDVNSINDAYGIIIFSIATTGIHTEFKLSNGYAEAIGDLLEQAIVYHAQTLMDLHFSKGHQVPFLLQNMDDRFLSYFKGYSIFHETKSHDFAKLVTFKVLNS
ncbi:hypothetical protein ACFQ3S_14995 [Mucilaginibacter terrae]|uniref:hypothetical protein n=1 Tax=Mucilaginibacter terrae TaxID=1955052 RepID=UPI0036258A93